MARAGRKKLQWYAWVLVGAFVTIYAQIVKSTSEEPGAMALFFWIGIVLIVVGVGKYMLKKRLKEEQQSITREQDLYKGQLQRQEQQVRSSTVQGQQTPTTPQQQAGGANYTHPQSNNIHVCPSCKTQNHATSAMCFRCGVRLR